MRASPNVPPMVAFGLVAVACLAPAPARAQDPATADKEKRQRLERQFQESLGWYQVSAGPNSGVMKPRPVLRWLNPTRGQKGEPTLILWTDAGRPQALASVYPWGTNLTYECVSLARGEGLTAREEGRTVWSPGAAGVTFRGLPDAPAPAATAAGRLKQAKAQLNASRLRSSRTTACTRVARSCACSRRRSIGTRSTARRLPTPT